MRLGLFATYEHGLWASIIIYHSWRKEVREWNKKTEVKMVKKAAKKKKFVLIRCPFCEDMDGYTDQYFVRRKDAKSHSGFCINVRWYKKRVYFHTFKDACIYPERYYEVTPIGYINLDKSDGWGRKEFWEKVFGITSLKEAEQINGYIVDTESPKRYAEIEARRLIKGGRPYVEEIYKGQFCD